MSGSLMFVCEIRKVKDSQGIYIEECLDFLGSCVR